MKKPKVNVHIKIDEELWQQAQPVIQEMGFTQSGFIEMMLRQFLKAETSTLSELIGDVLKEALQAQQRKKKRARD